MSSLNSGLHYNSHFISIPHHRLIFNYKSSRTNRTVSMRAGYDNKSSVSLKWILSSDYQSIVYLNSIRSLCICAN